MNEMVKRNSEEKPKASLGRRAAKGMAVTTTLAAAAGLAAAAFYYIRKRGVDPKKGLKTIGKSAGTAAMLLTGETKAAYDEVRGVVVAELRKKKKPATKADALTVTKKALAALKARGAMSKAEWRVFVDELSADWQSLLRDADTRRSVQ